ncbi:uncharacterized protein RHOBADRAFT_41056 [Rhodotorula graminis WP1]|uniref:Enoyl-CoA hydratase n=1 Tax=Rhodotorula graminis (strain WP1) TaxID=578459 RepID=A0A194SFW8_RHOGW|nr:uncharacterized protein RHOBADRAFT_41056 [Rhodotorula graminis WP1]KPV78511.1 hypothetical protein RHOBADRAFT_41056 [Rhodotorula graminis WP1]
MPQHPSVASHLVVDYPHPKVLRLRLNRPEALNAMTDALEEDIRKVLDWFEENNELWCLILTGTGRAFCAGQDLKNWQKTAGTSSSPSASMRKNIHGFGSLARRRSKKPFILALNGMAFGGGAEAMANADIVIAAEGIKVGFPEVKRGVVAGVGGIPNAFHRSPQLVPYLLTGNPIPTNLLEHVVFTEVVPADKVQDAALRWALDIVDNSPEAVWVTKEQVNLTRDGNSLQDVVIKSLETEQSERLYVGENLKEGLKAFVEKRKPVWQDPPALTRQSKL